MERDLLFISYAWEDGAAAEWLTLKLTSLGYRVWCDRFEMLGGDPWPSDIDDAIKNHTFRLLHLVSKHSLRKPNPVKERELALTLARERGIPDFLIPLNLDGTKPAELPWRLSDVTFIPFQDWAAGFNQLLKLLGRIAAPQTLGSRGAEVAASAFLPVEAVLNEPETIHSNCLPFIRVPEVVRRYQFSRPLFGSDVALLRDTWAFRLVDDRLALAFEAPPAIGAGLVSRGAGASLWASNAKVDGIYSQDLVAELLKKSVQLELLRRGLRWTPNGSALFFPKDLLERDRITFTSYTGKQTYVTVGGTRSLRGSSVNYRLGVSIWVRRDVVPGFALLVKLRLFLIDSDGKPIEGSSIPAVRKKIAGNWFNHAFLNRHLAIASFLAAGGNAMEIGAKQSSIVLAAQSIGGSVPRRVNEKLLERMGGIEPEAFDDEAEGAVGAEEDE